MSLSRFRRLLGVLATVVVMATATVAVADSAPALSPQPAVANADAAVEPLVIGHRGASGYRPEHTLEAYELAIDMGADIIEPDLVATSDGVLVARHENEISGTTDVEAHPEFAGRYTTKTIDGQTVTGWFTEDFTMAELETLSATERVPELRPDNTVFDRLYEIPTFQEVIDLAQERGVGIYPETKHPSYFDSIGLSLEEPLVKALTASGWDEPTDPVFIQSFETANLRQLDTMTDLPLVQLIGGSGQPYDFQAGGYQNRTYANLVTPRGLAWIATYADGIGPTKDLIVPRDANGNRTQPTTLVDDAHRQGLVVHPWTFRNENTFLPADLRAGDPGHPGYAGATGDAPDEYQLFFDLGVDGVFSDNPDTAVAARTSWTRLPRGDR